MSRSLLFTTLVSLTCTACEGAPPNPPGQPPEAFCDPALTQRIEAAQAEIQADTCFREQQDVSGCDWGDFPLDPNQFAMTENTGEAILVVDNFPELPPLAIRYKNRLKGFFRAQEGGTISAVPSSWHVPTTLYRILSGFASPDFIPAEALRPLRAPLDETYGFLASDNTGHGSFVFSVLIEANPQQPVLVLDVLLMPRFAPAEFCDASGSAESIARLREKTQHVAGELRRLMSEHNVRFVNVSSGETLASVRSQWTTYCGGAPLPGDEVMRAKLGAYSPIYDALFNTPGVFAAHASIDASNPLDYPYDQPSEAYPNRLRTGYFNALESGLDAEGRGDHSSLSGWPAPHNVDIYLNSGVLPQRPFPYNRTPLLQVDGFGVDIQPITRATTSWLTPLTLSRFINARYASFTGHELTNELITTLRGVLVPDGCHDVPGGRCLYQDPLKHGQTEAVRLGYRPREYVDPNLQQ
ncbi:hypothetical protein NR798_37530 [Archangium gephyra]|uniref:hypothetical protein n=1 Tax=Archangium gephyra TaxID=48 RepID=UPI0035D4F021